MPGLVPVMEESRESVAVMVTLPVVVTVAVTE
jgi:hypothetical protein